VIAVRILDLGRIDYREAHALQQRLTAERAEDAIPDRLLLLEHPHVFTRGRRSKEGNVIAAGDVPIVDVERGGDVTYHGPGQLVAYPIFALRDGERDAPGFIRRLEASLMAALADLGLPDTERLVPEQAKTQRCQRRVEVAASAQSRNVRF
jgi:lipoyl(octanoyl) transferase